MGNSVSFTSNININNGKISNVGSTNTFNTTASNVLYNKQTIPTSGWTLLSSSFNQYSFIHFETDDPTSTITVATDSSGVNKIFSLVPTFGGIADFTPPTGSGFTASYWAQSLPSSSIIEVRGTPY